MEGGKSNELTIEFQLLGNGQLHISRARREIQHQHVQTAPFDFVQELLEGFHYHQAAPDDGRGFGDQVAH